MKPLELSYTHSNDLLCPYRYWQLVGLGVQEEDDEASASGVLQHFAAAKYGYHLLKVKKFKDINWFYKLTDSLCEDYLAKGKITTDDIWRIQDEVVTFADVWSLDITADEHNFEQRMFASRDGGVPGDKFGGTPDYIGVFSGGRIAKMDEYKFGHRQLEYDEVLTDMQCLYYAWLWYRNHPECELFSARIIAPRFGPTNQASGDLRREYVEDYLREIMAANWAKVDECRESGVWPVNAHWDACKWCKMMCPGAEEIVEELRRTTR